MLFSLYNSDIRHALKGLKKLTKKKNNFEIEKHCLIETDSESVILKGHFDCTEVKIKTDAAVKDTGRVVVLISELDKICKKLKINSPITVRDFTDHNGKKYIEVSDDEISLYCSITYEPDVYPKFKLLEKEIIEKTKAIKVSYKEFRNLLDPAYKFLKNPNDFKEMELNGLRIEEDFDQIVFVSTNGYMILVRKVDKSVLPISLVDVDGLKRSSKSKIQGRISKRAIETILLLSKGSDNIKLFYGEDKNNKNGVFYFVINDADIIKIADPVYDRYPNYRSVLSGPVVRKEENKELEFIINRSQLLTVLNRFKSFISKKDHAHILVCSFDTPKVDNDKFKFLFRLIDANNKLVGSSKIEILNKEELQSKEDFPRSEKDRFIIFDLTYFTQCIDALNFKELKLSMTTQKMSMNGVFITNTDQSLDNWTDICLILPKLEKDCPWI